MSYILDALRRAEADRERERGQVPGLHTLPPSGGETTRPPGSRRWLPWAGATALLLGGVGAGLWWAGGTPDAVAPPPAPPPAPLPAPAAAPGVGMSRILLRDGGSRFLGGVHPEVPVVTLSRAELLGVIDGPADLLFSNTSVQPAD